MSKLSDQLRKVIFQRLTDANMTQASLAEKIGSKASTISLWLNGAKEPTLESWARISEALGTDLSSVLYEAEHGQKRAERAPLALADSMKLATIAASLDDARFKIMDLKKENEALRAERGQLSPELIRLVNGYLQANPLVRIAALALLTGDSSLVAEAEAIVSASEQRLAEEGSPRSRPKQR